MKKRRKALFQLKFMTLKIQNGVLSLILISLDMQLGYLKILFLHMADLSCQTRQKQRTI
mgnify:CR=1 FL=1